MGGGLDLSIAKLLAVKVGVLKKKSAASAIPPKVCASAFGPGSSTPGVKSFTNFENDSSSPEIEPRPNVLAHKSAGMAKAADFVLRTPTLTARNFAAL